MSADNLTTCPRCGGVFREDYEIYGAETGTVTVEYRGACQSCDARLSFMEHRDVRP